MKIFKLLLGLYIFLPLVANAVPSIKLRGKENLAISFISKNSDINCSYELFTSDRRKKITGSNPEISSSIISDQYLPTSRRATYLIKSIAKIKSARSNIFFRLKEQCGDIITYSKITKKNFAPDTSDTKVRLKKWLKILKEDIPFSNIKINKFSDSKFTRPIDIKNAGDNSGRLFIAQQTGIISILSSDGSLIGEFLNISSKTTNSGERGLLSLAFDPDFTNNRYVYLHYTEKETDDSIIARYTVSESNPNRVDAGSELIILRVTQPFTNHNGGAILFGADGYLYICLGDGGSAGDPEGNGQNRETLLGSILRINVISSTEMTPYQIPESNPFYGNDQNFKDEIYAYGFRNPWKASFDSENNVFWVADVGQFTIEEVNNVTIGENYGWNIVEGDRCYENDNCDKSGLTPPVFTYNRDQTKPIYGQSVTGGYVYRGQKIKNLYGRYIFGDFVSRRIFLLDDIYGDTSSRWLKNVGKALSVSSFGVDEEGELYVANYGDSTIYKFELRE